MVRPWQVPNTHQGDWLKETMNPNQQKIKNTISRYKRAMAKEKKEWGMISDGSGKRFLLGPLYLRIDDTHGALKHYQWFETTFPDDSGEPFHRMAWSLTLYRNGDTEEAAKMLLKTMFLNLYLFPILFGENPEPIQMYHGNNWAELPYVQQAPKWMLGSSFTTSPDHTTAFNGKTPYEALKSILN